MPELPEVEVTRQALIPHLLDQTIANVTLHRTHLRWPIAPELARLGPQWQITELRRRAKYLLCQLRCKQARQTGTLIIHLGMTGCCRVIPADTDVGKHDHMDMRLTSGMQLRYTDPRRFGALLWTSGAPEEHNLLCHLGPEPLEDAFSTGYLYAQAQKSRAAIKTLLMNHKVVVGIGNIYAVESLFAAGINPVVAANQLSRYRINKLVENIKGILTASIAQGGTTFRDFLRPEGQPGYFKQALLVYGRAGEPCVRCARPLQQQRITGRSTVYCEGCQTS